MCTQGAACRSGAGHVVWCSLVGGRSGGGGMVGMIVGDMAGELGAMLGA